MVFQHTQKLLSTCPCVSHCKLTGKTPKKGKRCKQARKTDHEVHYMLPQIMQWCKGFSCSSKCQPTPTNPARWRSNSGGKKWVNAHSIFPVGSFCLCCLNVVPKLQGIEWLVCTVTLFTDNLTSTIAPACDADLSSHAAAWHWQTTRHVTHKKLDTTERNLCNSLLTTLRKASSYQETSATAVVEGCSAAALPFCAMCVESAPLVLVLTLSVREADSATENNVSMVPMSPIKERI